MEIIALVLSFIGVVLTVLSRTDKLLRQIRDVLIEIRDQKIGPPKI